MPTHRSAAIVAAPHAWGRALGLACLLTTLWGSCATAQQRRAAIRVNVTVRDFAEANVLGAHAVPAPPAVAGLDRHAWHIALARGPALSVLAESVQSGLHEAPVPSVAICQVARDATAACLRHQLPALQVSGRVGNADLVVGVPCDAVPAAAAPVRLTLAYIGT